MKDEGGDERRGYLLLHGAHRSVCVFTGWTGLLAAIPAEVLRYWLHGTVAVLAESVHLSGSDTDLRSVLAYCCWSNWQQKGLLKKEEKQIVNPIKGHSVTDACASAALMWTRFSTRKKMEHKMKTVIILQIFLLHELYSIISGNIKLTVFCLLISLAIIPLQ